MSPQDILEYFEQRRASIIDAIFDIVEIESPSYNADQSRRVVSRIVEIARELPLELEIERIPADGFGEHLMVRAFPSDEKQVLLLGHTDTVHPLGTAEKNPVRVEGDRLFGCGTFDMKANIVLMFEALRFYNALGRRPPRPIAILLSCDEEIGSHSGRPLVEREAARSDFAMVFEPSFEGRLKTGRKGTGTFSLAALGRPAHAGLEPERGANAIVEIARQVESLQKLNNASAGTTVNVTTISGGTTSNVIPEHAECQIDVRFATAVEADRVESAIRGLRPFDEQVSLSVGGAINRPPMERTAEVVKLFEKARAIAARYDYELGEIQVGGASDGNFVAAMGVPVLDGLGITGDGAHTLSEHILVSDIAKRATLVTMLLSEAD